MRAAIAGAGFMGAVHGHAIRVAGGTIAGVAAASAASARRAADAIGAERAYDGLEELLADESIEVVHVCLPNHLHYELARAALEGGRHVVCEKPLATNIAHARLLAEISRSRGVVAAVPFVYRYYPTVREARSRVAAGETGGLHLIHGGYLQDWLLDARATNWRVDATRGGPSRALADIGSHWFDLAEFISADTIVAVSAQARIVHETRPDAAGSGPIFAAPAERDGDGLSVSTEDLAVVMLRTRRGVLGSAVVSQVAAGHRNHWWIELDGAARSMAVDHERSEVLTVGDAGSRTQLPRDPASFSPAAARHATLPAGHPQGYQDCFNAFIADAYGAIAGEQPDGLPGFESGLHAVAITEAALRSAHEDGAWIGVEPVRG